MGMMPEGVVWEQGSIKKVAHASSTAIRSHFRSQKGCSATPSLRTHLPTQWPRAVCSHLALYSQLRLYRPASRWRETMSTRTRRSISSSMAQTLLVHTMHSSLCRRFSQSCAVDSHWAIVDGGTVMMAHAPPPTMSSNEANNWNTLTVLPVPASCAHSMNGRPISAALFTAWRW